MKRTLLISAISVMFAASLLASVAVAHFVDPVTPEACAGKAESWSNKAGEDFVEGSVLYPLHRILRPNSIVTMDFNPARLNVYLDDDGKIIKAQCG